MSIRERLALGLDFGTESVRALLVTLQGVEASSAVVQYPSGQITRTLPTTGEVLPHDFALQDPVDWINAAAGAVKAALRKAKADPAQVVAIGVDFTSCTMLPALRDGTPLCQLDAFKKEKFAWPKLWKHHGAKEQTDRINFFATERHEPWLERYGSIIGLEWFFPKILETLDHAPKVYAAAEVWIEAGDWFVWQLTGTNVVPARSTCLAGYKAMWNAKEGYPSRDFFKALDPKMEGVVDDKMPGRMVAPGQPAGELSAAMAKKLGLLPGTVVSAAVIDAHAGVPGAGVWGPDTLVLVMGTSSCHMLNSDTEKLIPGVAGVVAGGILPGYYGYETGQAAVGDAFDWCRRLVGAEDFKQLDRDAAVLPPGAHGTVCVDWLNGCRTPLMDGNLKASFSGLTLNHTPAHLYRSLLEGSAFGVRWIVEVLQDGGVPVKKFVATGGLPHHNPLLVQIYSDVIGQPILVHPSKQGPALGAAILGVLAAGKKATGFASPTAAMNAMAATKKGVKGREPIHYKPNRKNTKAYEEIYRKYREAARV